MTAPDIGTMEPLMAAISQAGRHGAAVGLVVVVVAVIAVSAGLLRAVRFRKRSVEQSERDQGREP